MPLLTGPAGSGKTYRVLAQFRDALRARDSGVRLLTPTATMAQHFQNRLAREGFVFRPGLIQTLSRFVDSFAPDVPQASDALLYLVVEHAARRVNRPEFARVAQLPGFCGALARTIAEFSAAGCDAERLAAQLARLSRWAPLAEAFVAVYEETARELARRGLATRSQRLLHAAERIAREGLAGVHTVWMDGFYALPDPELAVIEAICRRADVTLTMPTAPITEYTRARLLAIGFAEKVCRWTPAQLRIELCEMPSMEREADEIARRILLEAAAGRPFRDMGVIVRSPEVYEQILRATLDRFGIPARFYFDADLARHAVVRFLAGAVDAMLGGWDYAETLAALRLAPGMACDEFDFAVRERMPGAGLAGLKRIAAEGTGAVAGLLREFGDLEEWRTLSLRPGEWATRLKGLRVWFRPAPPEPGTRETTSMWRGQAAALELFGGAMEEAARALDDRVVSLGEFWRVAKSVLRLTPLRMDDGRRNVVHVLGAHEARQWQLPVVFVCGLVEKQFPRFHTPDPFFPEAARAELRQVGIRMRTAADFEAEERFLFDSAITRATDSLTLSFPRCDARGQQNLRSLSLDGVTAAPGLWRAVRPRPARQRDAARPPAVIASADLRERLARQHRAFRPTALESYLQCPFQFFGRHTLGLKAAPPRPAERLNALVEGTIVHAVLAELGGDAQRLEQIFDPVFRRICEHEHIPPGYRAEACRERILTDLRSFLADNRGPCGVETRAEQKFQYALSGGVDIRGRIDRLDIMPDGRALVIDYKYSGAQNTKSKLGGDNRLQPQLYVLAAQRAFGLRVSAMFYCGLRGDVTWAGWGEDSAVSGARVFPPGWLEQAIETTARIADEIRTGQLAPAPADPELCPRCECRDVCRFRQTAPAITEGAGTWD
jgi:ATP-dependent helicase/DNAse subunit B